MRCLRQFADGIDGLNDRIGRTAAWLTLPVIALLFLQVPLREYVHYGHIAANDIGQIIHATLFMTGASYAMRWDGHVRVDIFYQRMSARSRAWVDLLGTLLFAMPWIAILGWYSLPITIRSWRVYEQFAETYTPGYFLLKTQLLVFVVLVGLQAFATVARAVVRLAASREPTSA